MLTYKDIYEFNIELMKDVLQQHSSGSEAWELFKTYYIDPDGYPLDTNGFKTRNGIECTVDAIISINRIYSHEGFNQKFIDAYNIYRKNPIMFFPRERGGINTSRYSIFGDRIDHTLFDLKQYFENKECKLIKTYELPKTKLWLDSFNNFQELTTYMNIAGIFTDENNDIYDLEKGNSEIVTSYCDYYNKNWSENYYKNTKEKIRVFNQKLHQ